MTCLCSLCSPSQLHDTKGKTIIHSLTHWDAIKFSWLHHRIMMKEQPKRARNWQGTNSRIQFEMTQKCDTTCQKSVFLFWRAGKWNRAFFRCHGSAIQPTYSTLVSPCSTSNRNGQPLPPYSQGTPADRKPPQA